LPGLGAVWYNRPAMQSYRPGASLRWSWHQETRSLRLRSLSKPALAPPAIRLGASTQERRGEKVCELA